MSESNGSSPESNVRLALLEQSTTRNKEGIEICQKQISKVDTHLELVKEVQHESLVVLQKMETSLEHMNEKLGRGEQARLILAKNQVEMSESFARTDSKFTIIIAILSAIGLSVLSVVIKLLFFST